MKKKFQGGGVVDETELFDDGVAIEGAGTGAEGNLGGEYVDDPDIIDPTTGTEGATNTEGPEGPSGQPGPVGTQLDAAGPRRPVTWTNRATRNRWRLRTLRNRFISRILWCKRRYYKI